MKYATLVNGRIRELGYAEAWKLALNRNPMLRMQPGFRVRVPAGTKRVYVPRRKHYQHSVFTESDEAHLNVVGDVLEPCIVARGAFGFGLHECESHGVGKPMGPVWIEETNARVT